MRAVLLGGCRLLLESFPLLVTAATTYRGYHGFNV